MRVLLDTNIIIHREASKIINEDIGVLFNWLDKLNYEKCIHPLTVDELNQHKYESVRKTLKIKLDSYRLLRTLSSEGTEISDIRTNYDHSTNDSNDTSLLNEVYNNRVDFFITEDRNIHFKSTILKIADRVFTIDSFLEKVTAENPSLTEYKVLSVRKEYFGNIDIDDQFFDSFKRDYTGFESWFNKKADETAYICKIDERLNAFLYLKVEDESEDYSDIMPAFPPKKRLKIGTFKVTSTGLKLGERFLKIMFDNALQYNVEEIYVTIFDKSHDQLRLIKLLEDWGFDLNGTKTSQSGQEIVLTRNFQPTTNLSKPKITYPFVSRSANKFIVPIYPDYHTELLPDSILTNESPDDFEENEPHRNAIQKVYISRSYFRNLLPGDIILFYRTKTPGMSAYYTSVITTIGVVERTYKNIRNESEFVSLCRKRSVFTDSKLLEYWNYNPNNRPFIVNFLYVYSFPIPYLNLQKLIELKIIRDVESVPRGFEKISNDKFETILKESSANARFIVN